MHRNRNVPGLRNRFLAATPAGSARWNDQLPPYAMTSWNPLTPRHLMTVPRSTVTVAGDQRVPTPRTITGLACAGSTSVTTSADAHAAAITTLTHEPFNPNIATTVPHRPPDEPPQGQGGLRVSAADP